MMRRLFTLLAIVGVLSPAAASSAPAQKPTLDSRLEVRFEATPAADVFRHIISGLGLELQLDANLDGPVTIWVKNVTARTALNVVCESLGCTWRTEGNRLVVGGSDAKATWVGVQTRVDAKKNTKVVTLDLRSHLAKPLPASMQFQDVPVSTILRALSEVTGLEITADEPIASTRVTLTASSRTVEDALKAVIDQGGGGKMGVFRIKGTGTDQTPAITIAIKSQVRKK
jgi:hypothetical protein